MKGSEIGLENAGECGKGMLGEVRQDDGELAREWVLLKPSLGNSRAKCLLVNSLAKLCWKSLSDKSVGKFSGNFSGKHRSGNLIKNRTCKFT